MRFSDLDTRSTSSRHSKMFEAYYSAVMCCHTLTDFLVQFDFSSRKEIEQAVKVLHQALATECRKDDTKARKEDGVLDIVKSQGETVMRVQGRLDKLAASVSGDLWHQHFAPLARERRFEAMFGGHPDEAAFEAAFYRIARVYDLDYADMEKLRFFVEQVKARDKFPPSLRRMLYIWGREKKTGKTTCAKMLVSTLNGSDRWQDADPDFTTTLANEMQIGGFKVPRIASLECCVMDECFYADMGKTYHDFKRFLTSSGGTARLPYGQEFQWNGRPNYVATSNEPLSSFIKDWGDRRFLSVEFKSQPTEQMDFPEIAAMWRDFVVNATPRFGGNWQAWSADIARYSDEVGERRVLSDEYATEMQKPEFIGWLLDKSDGRSATSPDNRITLLNIVNWFTEREGYDAKKHRKEIEQAFVSVYGEKLSGYEFWRIDLLRQRAMQMNAENVKTPF